MKFLLGTHEPSWLADPRFRNVPLFVSARRLRRYRRLPRAVTSWALDSGGFTELRLHRRWAISAAQYVREVRRWRDEIGSMLWAAPMDWMVEHDVLGDVVAILAGRGTGLTVAEHQRRTVASVCELRALAPEVWWIPVLQGWTLGDYLDCAERYEHAGIDLVRERLVGVGTMCRRQHLLGAQLILVHLAHCGLRLHAFGLKSEGLEGCERVLASADSLAWSERAKHCPPLPGHDRPGPGRRHGHTHCQNCAEFALRWRARLLREPCVPGLDGYPRLAPAPLGILPPRRAAHQLALAA
jgi:hypothetical protein